MKRFHFLASSAAAFAALIALQPGVAPAASFSYHGSLQDAGKPAQGSYDLELTLYSAPVGGKLIGGPLSLFKVPVHGSNFSVEADFGPLTQVTGQAWLGVKVRNAGKGGFAELSTRAEVSTDAASVCPGAWTLNGNAGTVPGTGGGQNYLGTADNQPLVVAVNGAQAARLAPSADVGHPDSANVVLGSPGNFVGPGIGGATVGGGGSAALSNCGPSANLPCVNSASGAFSTVAGGFYNTANGDTAAIGGGALATAIGQYSTIGGGLGNYAGGGYSAVCGGYYNYATLAYATAAGGFNNFATGTSATISGGFANLANATYSTVSGGNNNTASGGDATVAGGNTNTAGGGGSFVGGGTHDMATGGGATVAGGDTNTASGVLSAISGGNFNTAIGFVSMVPGGQNNQAGGDFSFAGGFHAHVRSAGDIGGANTTGDQGTFIWSDDSSASNVVSTGPNQFLIRAVGGVGINTTNPSGVSLRVGTSAANGNGAFLSNGGAWTAGSSRTFKEEFTAIDTGSVLAKVIELPVLTWFYKNDHDEGRHMGPVAEDFAALFGLGNDHRYIAGVDESGVAFAAIQGLNQKVESQNTTLRKENADLRSRLDDLQVRLSKLEGNRLENKQGE